MPEDISRRFILRVRFFILRVRFARQFLHFFPFAGPAALHGRRPSLHRELPRSLP
jgi:hypothetical protein